MSQRTKIPCIKGVAMIPVVHILRAHHAQARELLAPELQHYLDDVPTVSGWYPEADFAQLLLAIEPVLRDRVPGNAWEWLGREGATRALVREGSKNETPGVKSGLYAHAVRVEDFERNMRAAGTLWSLYHNTGRLSRTTGPRGGALMVLEGFEAATPQFCTVNGAYIRQATALGLGLAYEQLDSEHVECVTRGDSRCAWTLRVAGDRTAASEPAANEPEDDAMQRLNAAVRILSRRKSQRPSAAPES